MSYSSNEIKVGAVIAVGFVVLTAFISSIIGVNWNDNKNEYRTSLQNVSGIAVGSLVKFGGLDVGYVADIQLPKNFGGNESIQLVLKVDKRTPVRHNSKAFVTTVGIMASQHIEISRGSTESELLPDDSLLPSKEVPNLMQMSEPFADISAEVQSLVANVNSLFDETNKEHLSATIAGLDKFVTEGGNKFLTLSDNLEKLTTNFATISTELNELLANNKGTLEETFVNIEKTAGETNKLVTELRQSLGQFDTMLSANGANVSEIMENFQFASRNLEELSRAVKNQPWLLVRKAQLPERKLQ